MARVVMVVGNDVTTDTRVRKSALALADVGHEVTIVCHAGDGRASDSYLGSVLIKRVPIDFRKRDELKAAIERRKNLIRPLRRIHPRLHRLGTKALAAYDKAMGTTAIAVSWRDVVPEAVDTERAFAPVLAKLPADVVHSHDVQVMHIVDAAARAKNIPWVYDAHEFVSGLSRYGRRTRRVIAAWAQLEEEYIGRAHRVITVSPQLADELQRRYALPQIPAVVLNAPPLGSTLAHGAPSIREALGLADEPLLVYSGGVTQARGVHTAVEALKYLPGVHLAVVAVPHINTYAVGTLNKLALREGTADRLHLLNPVPSQHVSAFLRDATVGLIPIAHFGSHEVALANKLFEYIHAGIPVVVSDCRAQQEFVKQHRIGTVHRAGDAQDFARAVQELLADNSYQSAISGSLRREFSWQPQAQVLVDTYSELLGSARSSAVVHVQEPPEIRSATAESQPVVCAIGPANSAGQGWAWMRAAQAHLPDVSPFVLAILNNRYDFAADMTVSAEDFARSRQWAQEFEQQALASWTHCIFEAGRPILGTRNGKNFVGDVAVMRAAGIQPALVFHGSEIRDPRSHAAREPYSPFRDPEDALTHRLQTQRDLLMESVQEFDGPVFVSTPDLLDDLPHALWLPVVVNPDEWAMDIRIERDVPIVLHLPSHTQLKGTGLVDATMHELHEQGLINYHRISGVSPEEAARLIRRADIVLDQFALGSYGVLACQAMAAGKAVVGHVRADVRSRIGEALPIVEADPSSIAAVVADLVAEPNRITDVGRAGQAFVARVHDGRVSAAVLADFLGRPAFQLEGVALTLGTSTSLAAL